MSFMQNLFNRLGTKSGFLLNIPLEHCKESSGFLYSCKNPKLSLWSTDCSLSQKLLLAELSIHRLVQIFTGNTLLEEEVWPFCVLPCVLALRSFQDRAWPGGLFVHCQMFVLFPPLKEKLSSSLCCSRYQGLSCMWLNRVWPLPNRVILARGVFTAALIIRRGVSLRHSINVNQEDVLCLLCFHIPHAEVSPRSKGLLLRWACLCSVPDLICCIC